MEYFCGYFFSQVNDEYSSLVVAQLLFLQSEDHKKPIQMYINSPGIYTCVYCVSGWGS